VCSPCVLAPAAAHLMPCVCVQVKRERTVHQINTLDEVQQQQPRLTIVLSNSPPASSPPPLGYQPPSCTVDRALARHVTSAAAAAAKSLLVTSDASDVPVRGGRLGKRLRAGQPVLAPRRQAAAEE
jgi:hypothetical protein